MTASAVNADVPTNAPYPSTDGASRRAVGSLVTGVLGLLAFGLLSPVAWLLGLHELNDIRAGRAPAAGESMATVGTILGAVGTILAAPLLLAVGFVVLAVLWAALLAVAL